MTGLKPYPKYKDSGVEWLGNIPEGWNLLPNRKLFIEIKKSGYPDEDLLSVTISKGVIKQSDLLSSSSKKDSSNEDKSKYKLVEPRDIAYNKMRAWQGAIGESKYRGIVSPAYIVVRPLQKNNAKYFHYLFRTLAFTAEAERWSYGITSDQWSLRPEHFKMIYCTVPPISEQNGIVKFLDIFNTQIRKYISQKQKLVKLLNEQKQAIINQAVTRGLDPNVRLKPSGVDWLGDIPEHWEVKRLKFLAQNITEQKFSKTSEDVYIALDQIESWTGNISVPKETIDFESQVKHFYAGDILFCKLRPYLAKVCRPEQNGVCVSELLVLRPDTFHIFPKFFEQKLRSFEIIDIINSSTFGAKMPRADWLFIGNLSISYPDSIEEQEKIVEYIEKNTENISFTIEQNQKQIDLMKEYRTRLISDVVTGKIDVRDIKLPEIIENIREEDIIEEEEPEENMEIIEEEMDANE